ncbi:MAG: helix-turn-helix transcriptional regulator, partial [Clostridia bacterium]|nr:helix-turn-helix transcriptional regulator [Clostridia bacterium]
DIVSECVLMYTFSRLTGVKDPNRDVASLLASYAEENFSDGGLSLNSLADDWGYNAKYLSDCFKKRMGMGFSHYLKTLRVKHAVFLMEHGVESVKNVAYLCGFRDPLYFSKVFRESLGVSPKEYLRRNREGNDEA